MGPLPRLLFVLKHREGYWGGYDLSSGLLNSVTFIVDMLNDLGIPAKIVQVPDNNSIWKEINAFKPTMTIIEAFWVVPEKFDTLMKMFPHMSWAVRNHSEIPFLQHEGISMEWVHGYLKRGIEIMNNSKRAVTALQAIAMSYGGHEHLISYAPNYYPITPYRNGAFLPSHVPSPSLFNPRPRPANDTIKVGCFGAIRPLKNQLQQAIAAIRYAYALGRKLEFHINATRVEGHGDTIIKNIRNLFKHAHRATLVEHPWVDHKDFLKIVSKMDVCMQVSYSETFNIVSADAVSLMVPVVASREVSWLGPYAWADPNDNTSILNNMLALDKQVKHHPQNNRLLWQWRDLSNYSRETQRLWWDRFGSGKHHGLD